MTAEKLTYRCPHCRSPVKVETYGPVEVLVCPHAGCGKPFRVEVPAAEALASTARADLEIRPGQPAFVVGDGARGTAPRGAPPAPTAGQLNAPGHDYVVGPVRPTMFRGYPFRFLAYAGLVILGAVAMFWMLIHGRTWLALASLALAVYGLYHLGVWWLKNRHTTLIVTQEQCTLETGLFTTQTTTFPTKEVADVHVNQNMLNRFLDVGELVLATDGAEKKELVLKAVPSPRAWADRILSRQVKQDAATGQGA